MRRRTVLATIGSLSVGLAGCIGSGSSSGEFDIGMSTSRFRPDEFEVAPGTTVVWKNTSKSTHTVTAYERQLPDGADFFSSGDFESEKAAREGWLQNGSGGISQQETYEHTFEIPGRYPYVCIPHENTSMVGAILVTEDATRTPKDGVGVETGTGTRTRAGTRAANETNRTASQSSN